MKPATGRRDQLCDAAIAVIARLGLRGLTHRAVDQATGVPEGSTSYYFRTRMALLTAVTHRLLDLDLAAATPSVPLADIDVEHFADLAAAMVADAVGPGRARMLARYEISLQASRQPDLAAAITSVGAGMRAAAADFLASVGAPDPVRQGRDLLSCIDGLIYDQLAGAGGPRSTEDVRATVRDILRGMLNQ